MIPKHSRGSSGFSNRSRSRNGWGLAFRCLAAFLLHTGRSRGVQAAQSVTTQPRHRAPIRRFLGRRDWRKRPLLVPLQAEMVRRESNSGRFVFILEQPLCSQQGDPPENTYSTGNRPRRPQKGRRYRKYKYARKRCHCFVVGRLMPPRERGFRFDAAPIQRNIASKRGGTYRKQTELAVELIQELPLPEAAEGGVGRHRL
jgi:hypothetical protein